MGMAPRKPYIPPRYNAATELTAEVTPGGENEFPFVLQGPEPPVSVGAPRPAGRSRLQSHSRWRRCGLLANLPLQHFVLELERLQSDRQLVDGTDDSAHHHGHAQDERPQGNPVQGPPDRRHPERQRASQHADHGQQQADRRVAYQPHAPEELVPQFIEDLDPVGQVSGLRAVLAPVLESRSAARPDSNRSRLISRVRWMTAAIRL